MCSWSEVVRGRETKEREEEKEGRERWKGTEEKGNR